MGGNISLRVLRLFISKVGFEPKTLVKLERPVPSHLNRSGCGKNKF